MDGATQPREDAYQRLFRLAPDAHVVTDLDGLVHDANGRAALLLGAPVAALVGSHLRDRLADGEWRRLHGWLLGLTDEHLVQAPEAEATVVPSDRPPFRATLRVAVSGDDPDHRQVQWAIHDVDEARQAQTALQAAYDTEHAAAEHLREVEAWRTAFLAAAAHDLRSPLAGIRAHAETLIERAADLSDEQRTLFLHRILHTSDRLSALLDDLLDLDRATRGTVQLQLVPTAVGAFVRDLVADHPTRGREVRVVVEGAPQVLADRLRLGQVVVHLLDNALHHTPPDASITITVASHEDGARVVVEDDGPGVPEAVRDRLFVPFVAEPTADTDDRRSGIGLSLVDLFVRLHGGEVHHQERPGGGARFVVELPAGSRG